MRYVQLKRKKMYGNCSWRQTIYTSLIGSKTIRDSILEFRVRDSMPEERKFNIELNRIKRGLKI